MTDLPLRKPIRLKGFDYSTGGAYFVTVCTQEKKHRFQMETVGNDLCVVPPLQNQIIHTYLKEAEKKFNIEIDKYIIMPNHLHMIVVITERHAGRSLQEIMQWFKTMTTNAYIRGVKDGMLPPFDKKLWQKSYHDHVIRGEQDYREIWQYIDQNPLKWSLDKDYCE